MSNRKLALLVSCLALVPIILTGCSEKFALVSFGIERSGGAQWVKYSPHRGAEQPRELSVLEAARDHTSISEGGFDVLYIVSDATGYLVAVVKQVQAGEDWLVQRQVVRYWVMDGKIAAKSPATMEVFPDVEFERAVIITARKAGSLNPVTLYESEGLSVSMASRVLNRCSALVRIYDKDYSSSTPLAEKVVRFCQ